MLSLLPLMLHGVDAHAQDKFYSFPDRAGAEGARANAQMQTVLSTQQQQQQEVDALNAAIDGSLTAIAADIDALQVAAAASMSAILGCGDQGMIGGPLHPTANPQDCLPSLTIDSAGQVVFSQPTRHQQGLILGDNPTCDAASDGMLRYISSQKSVMLCTDSTWIEVGAAPSASGVFTPVANAALTTQYTSNAVGVSGFFGTRTATASNGATILVNGVAQGSSAEVQAGNTIALRMSSAATYATAKTTNLNLSSLATNWTITTRNQDTTPNSFSFSNLSNQELNTTVTSNVVTVNGFDGPLTVSVSGQGNPQVRIGAGAWGTSGDVNPGESLQLRLTSSGANSTTRIATLVLGTATVNWSVETGASYYTSCQAAYNSGNIYSGTYNIRLNSGSVVSAYCQMVPSSGHGWTRVVGINGSNSNHITASAVNPTGMGMSNSHGKFSDSDISALASTEYRLTCNSSTYYFQASTCNPFSSTATGGSACRNYSATAGGPYSSASGHSSHYGLNTYQGAPTYVIYGGVGLNGCHYAPQHLWGGSGSVYVR